MVRALAGIQTSVDGRARQLHAKACEWIDRNPHGFSLLVHRSLAHANAHEKFSIRQLCEKLRWEKEHGLFKDDEEYAIPNAITRYLGLEIMRRHHQTEQYMSTRKPKTTIPTDLYTGCPDVVEEQIGMSMVVAAWAKEELSSEEQILVWRVDLEVDLGSTDDNDEPDVYEDGRYTELLSRLSSKLKTTIGTTKLIVLTRCHGGNRHWPERGWTVTELQADQTKQQVDLHSWTTTDPPIGSWRLMTAAEIRRATVGDNRLPTNQALVKQEEDQRVPTGVPVTYFLDGIPF